MKCPNCGNRNKIDVKEGNGFSQDVRECGACGTTWTFKNDSRQIIKEGKQILMES